MKQWINNPTHYPVRYNLSHEFRQRVQALPGCSVLNVIEIKSNLLLLYILDVPAELVERAHELAFMTHIQNPAFQTIYQDTPAFKEWAREKYPKMP